MKRLTVALLMVAAGAMGWRALRERAEPKLLFDRFWIDHNPRDYKEQFLGLHVSGEYPVGNYSTRTTWTGRWEGFHYHVVPREEGAMDLMFPATNEHMRVKYRAWRCHENDFDYCLEISGSSRGTKRYYSKKAWETRSDDIAATARLLGAAN
jgi:hypothetical protein